MSRVYASLPLTGPPNWLGREILRGAQLALERAERPDIELVALDCSSEDPSEQALVNARRAAEDERALAYLGELHPSLVEATAPSLDAAGLLQVAPLGTAAGLTRETLVWLRPHERAGAKAVAEWLVGAGVDELLVVHAQGHAAAVAALCVDAASDRDVLARSQPVWDQVARAAEDLGEAQAVLFVAGGVSPGLVALWHELHAAKPDLWLLAHLAAGPHWLPRELEPAAAARSRFFTPQRATPGFYGFEAMDLALDAISRGGDGRATVVRAARSTSERNSILGRYSIDADGYTTSEAYGRLVVVEGRSLGWELPPQDPADVKGAASRVYVSLPLGGPVGWLGRNVLRGAELALERAQRPEVELVVLDCAGDDPVAKAVANARRAAEDERALAYLGDYNSPQVLATAPILGTAGLLQAPPLATSIALRGETLVRLTPHDGAGARALADWLVATGVEEALLVHDEGYSRAVAVMCLEAGRERGLLARLRPTWGRGERAGDELGEAQAVVYVGDVAGSATLALWRELHAAKPDLWLIGRVDLVEPWIAGELEPAIAARSRFFVPLVAAYPFYGFEAMDFILDAISRGGGERAGTVRAARATSDRSSILGRYSIDAHGYTTSEAYGRRAIIDGQLVWDVPTSEPLLKSTRSSSRLELLRDVVEGLGGG